MMYILVLHQNQYHRLVFNDLLAILKPVFCLISSVDSYMTVCLNATLEKSFSIKSNGQKELSVCDIRSIMYAYGKICCIFIKYPCT